MAEQERHILYKLKPALSGDQVADAVDIEVDGVGIAGVDDAATSQAVAESLQTQITQNRQAQSIARGSFDTFNDSFTIDDSNAAVNGGRVNIYSAKIDKIVEVDLPTTAHLATAGISYPYGIEFVHSAGTARLTTNNILRIDSGDPLNQTGNRIDVPILDGVVPSSRFQMFQDDIALFVKDNAGANYRVLVGAFDPIAEITRRGVFAFRNDIDLTDIDDIATILTGVTVNQGDALLVQGGGTRFGYDINAGDVILAKVDSPSTATDSDDWLLFSENAGLTSDQMAFFGNVERDGTRFDTSRNVFVNAANVLEQQNTATGVPLQLLYFTTSEAATARSVTFANRAIQFADLVGGQLTLAVNFNVSSSSGFLPELTSLTFTYGSTDFVFPLTSTSPNDEATVTIDIPNVDYSSILNTNCDITLDYQFRGASFVGTFTVNGLTNSLTGTLHDAVENLAQGQAMMAENRVGARIDALAHDIDNDGAALQAIQPRISPFKTVTVAYPDPNALFLDSTGSDAFPTSLASMNAVSADNPRFTGGDIALFVAARSGANHTLRNITTSTDLELVASDPNVDLGASLNDGTHTYFVYRISGLTSGHVYEVERVESSQIVAWPDDIDNLQEDVDRIDAELDHALLNLDDEVVQVFENEVSVTEETSPTTVATDYNKSLGNTSAQTVFYETSPNTPGGGVLDSKPISDTAGTDRERRKLVYIPTGEAYSNKTYLSAYDGATTRDIITYVDGTFFAKVFVPANSAGSSTEVYYPAPSNRVSGAGIWQNIPTLTFQNGIPVPEADELFFTRNIPTAATTLTIQYRGHANGNVIGAGSTTLANVGGSSEVATTFTVTTGGESATVEVRYLPSVRQIRVSVTENVYTGLPTIQDVEVILSYSQTVTIPATAATTRDVAFDHVDTGGNVFAVKPSSATTLVLVSDEYEIDTGYAFTTLFGASENGYMTVGTESGTFLDYEDFEPIPATVTDLQHHETLPQFGLFTTEYTHLTTLVFDTQMQARNSQDDIVNLGQELVLVASDSSRWKLSVETDGTLTTTELT